MPSAEAELTAAFHKGCASCEKPMARFDPLRQENVGDPWSKHAAAWEDTFSIERSWRPPCWSMLHYRFVCVGQVRSAKTRHQTLCQRSVCRNPHAWVLSKLVRYRQPFVYTHRKRAIVCVSLRGSVGGSVICPQMTSASAAPLVVSTSASGGAEHANENAKYIVIRRNKPRERNFTK